MTSTRARGSLPLLLLLSSIGHRPAHAAAPAGAPWLDGGIYRLKVEGTRDCSAVSAANNATDSRDVAPSLGFLVRIESTTAGGEELFVSPRDLTLEAGGTILESIEPTSQPRDRRLPCAPLLSIARLKAGRVSRGYVLFRVPASFRESRDPIALVYRPRRWGGAKRVAFPVQIGHANLDK